MNALQNARIGEQYGLPDLIAKLHSEGLKDLVATVTACFSP
jgi:hypothetical protein